MFFDQMPWSRSPESTVPHQEKKMEVDVEYTNIIEKLVTHHKQTTASKQSWVLGVLL